MGISNFKVYTPSKYANIIVNLALKNYFKGDFTKEKLDKIRVADLSCGTGNLLLVILEKIIILSKKITGDYYYNSEWIKGYDVDNVAFEEYVKKGEKTLKKYNLKGKILGYVKDSLLSDISEKEKYNIIIGNPPYIGEKNHQELFSNLRKTEFGRKYYEAKMDYFYYFIEKGIDILQENGVLVYVTTNYWLKADSAVKLRGKLRTEGIYKEIIDYNVSIFKNAMGQHNMIFSWKKTDKKENIIFVQKEDEKFKIKNSDLYDEKGNIILVNRENFYFNKNIIEKSNYRLGDILNINQGIVSGCDKAFVVKEYDENFKDYLKPFYKNKDIFKYNCNLKNDFWIFYIEKGKDIPESLKEKFLTHLELLEKRREVKQNKQKWWELSWERDKSIMTGEKILVRQRCKTNYFAYDNGEFYGSADIYYLTLKNKNFNIFYILGFLNSKIFYIWYKNNGKAKGYNLEFYTTPLKQVPIYYPENRDEIDYIEKLVRNQIENFSEEIQEEIDKYFFNLYNVII